MIDNLLTIVLLFIPFLLGFVIGYNTRMLHEDKEGDTSD